MIRIFTDEELASLARRLCVQLKLVHPLEQAEVYHTVLALGVANRAAYWFDIENAEPLSRPDVNVEVPGDVWQTANLYHDCAELYFNCRTQSGLSFLPEQADRRWRKYLAFLPGRPV